MSNYKLMVYVQRRPHMRDPNLEYLLHMGFDTLRKIFDSEEEDLDIKELTLFYPERWMNIVEERSLFRRLDHFCPNLEEVTITTQSVYIMQCTRKDSLLVISSPDELLQLENNEISQEATTGRLWYHNAYPALYPKVNATYGH